MGITDIKGIIAGEDDTVKNLFTSHIDLSGCVLPTQSSISWYMFSARIAILLPVSLIALSSRRGQMRQVTRNAITIACLAYVCQGGVIRWDGFRCVVMSLLGRFPLVLAGRAVLDAGQGLETIYHLGLSPTQTV